MLEQHFWKFYFQNSYALLYIVLNMFKETPKVTPMMQQYLEIKKSLSKNILLFYRLGDFYELFNDDAEIGSRLLGITLTHRGESPMAGIPYHAAESYINKILKSGYKIAICDQVSEPKPGQLVKRALSRILTPGTVISDQHIEAKHNSYLLALHLSKYGLAAAWIEVSTGDLQVSFSEDPQKLIPVLSALAATEIILSESEQEFWEKIDTNTKENLANLIKHTTLSILPNFRFDRTACYELICSTLSVHNLRGFGITGKLEYTIEPTGALLYYISENLRTENQNLTNIKVYSLSETMILDSATIKSLELFQSSHFSRDGSLLSVIDRTVTAAGARLLEQYFLSPLLNLIEINRRQLCVGSFLENLLICERLRNVLKKTYDLARIITRLKNRLKNPRELGAIKVTLKTLEPIKQLLNEIRSEEIININVQIETFSELTEFLSESLRDELPIDLSDGGYIKNGFNVELDHLRDLHLNYKNWISDLERDEQQKTGIKNLRIKFNGTFGYFIEVTKSNLNLVPAHYIRRQTTVNAERYITEDLKKKEYEILNAEKSAIELEAKLFDQILIEILKYAKRLQKTANLLAELDVYCGWASLAYEYKYCCPNISNDFSLEIKNGRHPVVEQNLQLSTGICKFVPNDTTLNNITDQIMIITGPNMAGKSTYIRQIALITFLAHIGCWVPADSCKIGIVDRIFARVGAGDDLSQGNSTFMVEMTETANILNNMTDRSLVIIDEIGRGTSTYDGLSIAWSVVEYIEKRNTRTLFATHYHELTKLTEYSSKIKNYKMAVKEWNDEIIFLREVIPGAADKSYGIHVARLAGLPKFVLERSREILSELESEGNTLNSTLNKKRKKSSDSQIELLI